MLIAPATTPEKTVRRLVRRAPHRASPPRSRTSCGRRSRGSWRCSTRPSFPGADIQALIDHARAEVEHAGALIDEILFLSELESGKEVVALGRTNALPVLEQVVEELESPAARAGVVLRASGDPSVDLPLRPRMLRIIAENLAENAIRYAGHGATFTLSVTREGGSNVLAAADDGIGVGERPAAAVRALLARRCRTGLARHRPRPRDREARDHGSGRHASRQAAIAAAGSRSAVSFRRSGCRRAMTP